jgi:protein-S-isoprenylcysteine O-methyltransferase Ste14
VAVAAAAEHGLLALLWAAWCALHSALISVRFDAWLRARLGGAFRFHRLAYNAVALVTIVPVWWYGTTVDGPVVLRWSGPLAPLRVLLLAAAFVLLVAGAARFDLAHFVGLRQLRSATAGGAADGAGGGRLARGGVLEVTRHPWYLATLLVLWCARGTLDSSALVRSVVLSVYVVIGAVLEERKLILRHGDAYRAYRQEVSMLVPFRFLVSRLRPKG